MYGIVSWRVCLPVGEWIRAARPKWGWCPRCGDYKCGVWGRIIPVLSGSNGCGCFERNMECRCVRTFAETAFFHPSSCVPTGKAKSAFWFIPPRAWRNGSLWGWHIQEVDYGRIEATATASKEFMLQPNMPRFVRVVIRQIAASLINLSDKAVAGTVRMELFNPETEKVFYTQKQQFRRKAGETGNVSFTFDVTDKYTVPGMPHGGWRRYVQWWRTALHPGVDG